MPGNLPTIPVVLSVALSSVITALAAPAAADTLVPHRAIYSLSRHPNRVESDISAVSGRLELKFEASCDGWGIEQFIGFRLYDANDRH